jgi:hypothetical protein
MFNFNPVRVATAAIGALVLSTVTVAAAVGPAYAAHQGGTAYASVQSGPQAHG